MYIAKAKNVTTAEKNLIVKFTKMCFKEIAKKEHELVDGWGDAPTVRQLQNRCIVNVKYRNQRSNGGKDQITLDVASLRKRLSYFGEYAAFCKDPVIGSMKASPEVCMLGIVAHEVSHHIQYRYGPHTRWLKNTYRKPHGHGFQDIYRILRSRVVNPFIDKGMPEVVATKPPKPKKRKATRHEKTEAKYRREAVKLMKQYESDGISFDNDSGWDRGGGDRYYHFEVWVSCPDWLDQKDDPHDDEHFSHYGWDYVVEMMQSYVALIGTDKDKRTWRKVA